MVLSVAFFHHHPAIITGSRDHAARVWDLDTGQERFVLPGFGKDLEAVAVAPDDKVVVTGGWGEIHFWDAETRAPKGVLKQGDGVMALAFSPDGRFLASAGSEGTVRLWDVASRQLLWSVQGQQGCVWSVAFSPDGKLLASGGEDKTARLWNAADGREVATLPAVGASPSPDGADGAAPSALPRAWLAGAAIVVLVTALALLGLFLWARRRPAAAPAAGAALVPVACPGCGHSLRARAELAGKKGKCPKCGRLLVIPGPAGAAAAGGPLPA